MRGLKARQKNPKEGATSHSLFGGNQFFFARRLRVRQSLARPAAAQPHQDSRDGKHDRKHTGEEHDELPHRAAPASVVDPSDPLRRAIAGQRIRQAPYAAVAVVHGDRDQVAGGIAQLHAPRRRWCLAPLRRFASLAAFLAALALATLFGRPAFGALAAFAAFGRRPAIGLGRQKQRGRPRCRLDRLREAQRFIR